MIKKIYFDLVVSTLFTIKSSPFYSDVWKIMSFFFLNLLLGFNLIAIYLLIEEFLIPTIGDYIVVHVISDKYWNALINLTFYGFFIVSVLNFFLIFYKRKYEKLFLKYLRANSKKICGAYYFVSCIFIILVLLILL